MKKIIIAIMAAIITAGVCFAGSPVWKFGVISDTQWTGSPDDGMSPGTTPAGIIQQCDQAFIAAGVKFVIAVGDTVDTGSQSNMDVRARYAQDLYNAGIGFFPYRGNHESGWTGSAAEEARIYPQIVNGGTNNLTPSDVLAAGIGHDTRIDPVAASGSPFALGANFAYPTSVNGTNINAYYGGLSYAFDVNNVRFVLIDQFENQNPGGNLSSAPQQIPWVAQELADAGRPQHAFVFDHKNLLGGNHKDNIMGANIGSSDPGDGSGVNTNSLSPANYAALITKEQAEDAFITTLATNNVHFYISGHDHHHYDSIVKSPLSNYSVHQIISASDSSKFYTPSLPVSTNDTPVSQDLYKLGYYIYTVDGPRVTVDYYGVDMTTDPSFVPGTSESIITNTPTLTGRWQKILSYGYSLNGQEFVVPQGASYATVSDTTAKAVANYETGYIGTSAQILAGINGSTGTNNYGKPWSKAVDTGWTPASGTASDILTLWGLAEIGKTNTDTYALSISYNPALTSLSAIQSGTFGLLTRATSSSGWVNAPDLNVGGVQNFVLGSWNSSYALGTCGVDTNAHTVWAVVNHASDFAVGTLPHKSLCAVQVQVSGRGIATPVSTNVSYLTDLTIAASAIDTNSFISDIQTNGVSIGGSFGMNTTNYTWKSIVADGTALVVFGDITVTNATPIWWLIQNGLTSGVAGDFNAAALADTDHTGMPNWAKFLAGINPTNPQSVFELTSIAPIIGGSNLVVQWSSVPGHAYDLLVSTNLVTTPFVSISNAIPASVTSTNSATVPLPAGGPYFFRVRLR